MRGGQFGPSQGFLRIITVVVTGYHIVNVFVTVTVVGGAVSESKLMMFYSENSCTHAVVELGMRNPDKVLVHNPRKDGIVLFKVRNVQRADGVPTLTPCRRN